MAISMPRLATTWPKPRPPSSRAITGVSASTVIGLFGFTWPVLMDPAYCGMRIAPWESWPRRLARTSSVATRRASASGVPRPVKMRVASASSLAGAMVGMASGYRKSEELGRRFTFDEPPRGGIERGGVQRGAGVVVAHVEGIVAADHHAVRAQLLDDEAEIARGEGERVHVDALGVLARLLGDRLRPFRPHVPAVIEPSQREGERPASVREADAEVGQPLQHAAEDELRDGERRLQRIADDQGEVVLGKPLLPDQRARR